MRRVLTVVLAAIMAAVVAAPFGAAAQTQQLTLWFETDSIRPASGCVMEASIEIRSAGAAVSGADVIIALSNSWEGYVYSSDRVTTDENGIAYIALDTTPIAQGGKAWLDVVVNGTYVDGDVVWVDGDSCGGTHALKTFSGSAPVNDSVVDTASEVASSNDAVIIPGITAYQQQRPLSCEYASVSIATGALGAWVSEYDMEAVTPLSDNPHWGYRGNINGVWGNTTDYGIYADALVPGLQQFGFNGDSFYGDADDLIWAIDNGMPTIVWLGMWGDLSHDEYASDGTRYQLTRAMHVMVAYGYDDGGVYLSDPGTAQLRYYDWATFNAMWDVMDGMALSVSW